MSEIPKCRVLLDVDGVLNAVTRSPNPQHWPDWQTAECMGFTITYSPSMGKRLFDLTTRPGVELIWLTTWEHNANDWISPLFGWPEFRVLDRHDIAKSPSGLLVSESGWWKLDEAKALYDVDSVPFVWIDDDLNGFYDNGASKWVRSLNGAALAIRPSTQYGLTPKLLRKVEEFVDLKTLA